MAENEGKSNSINCVRKYGFDDFNVPCKDLAKKLLGKYLVRKIGDTVVKGKIVETECYLGGEDKASHSYNGKKTERNEPMFMDPGTCYVYLTYGMYHCFNISSKGEGAAVLLRALEPIEGIETIKENRRSFKPPKNKLKELKSHELLNGPAKLCIGFRIDLQCNKRDLSTWDGMWIEDSDPVSDNFVVASSRIGIDSVGQQWASAPLRFYQFGNTHVSKRDRKAEENKFPQSPAKLQKSGLKRKLVDT